MVFVTNFLCSYFTSNSLPIVKSHRQRKPHVVRRLPAFIFRVDFHSITLTGLVKHTIKK